MNESILNYDLKAESPNILVRSEEHPIKKLILYKRDYLESRFDCDRCNKALLLYQSLFGEIANNAALSPDTLNSFYTVYRQLLITADKTFWKSDFAEYCRGKVTKPYAMLKQLRYEWILSSKVWAHYEEINENADIKSFAHLTHTIGNLSFVPTQYNFARARDYGDFWDLSLENIRVQYDTCFKIYYGKLNFEDVVQLLALEPYMKNGQVELFFEGHSQKNLFPSQNQDIIEMVKIINKKIKERGKLLENRMTQIG